MEMKDAFLALCTSTTVQSKDNKYSQNNFFFLYFENHVYLQNFIVLLMY